MVTKKSSLVGTLLSDINAFGVIEAARNRNGFIQMDRKLSDQFSLCSSRLDHLGVTG